MKRNTNATVKSETKSKKKKAWRFYRSNLCTLVWDQSIGPDGGIMADFSKGHFTTNKKKVADKLKEMGYPEIGLKDTSPPNIIVNQPVNVLKDGENVPVLGRGISEALGQQTMANITQEVKAPQVVES